MPRQAITRRDLLEVFVGLLILAVFTAGIWIAWSIPYLLEPFALPTDPAPQSNTRLSVPDAQRMTGR